MKFSNLALKIKKLSSEKKQEKILNLYIYLFGFQGIIWFIFFFRLISMILFCTRKCQQLTQTKLTDSEKGTVCGNTGRERYR